MDSLSFIFFFLMSQKKNTEQNNISPLKENHTHDQKVSIIQAFWSDSKIYTTLTGTQSTLSGFHIHILLHIARICYYIQPASRYNKQFINIHGWTCNSFCITERRETMKITQRKDILPAIFTFHVADMAPWHNLNPNIEDFCCKKTGSRSTCRLDQR